MALNFIENSDLLFDAVKGGDVSQVRDLLNRGANVNAQGGDLTPLHMAAVKNNSDIVKLLVENGADINAKDENGKSPLDVANLGGKSEVINFLREKEALGYAVSITNEFEKVIEEAGLKSGISKHRLNIDFVEVQKEITKKIVGGKFGEISGVLSSYLEKAFPGRESGYPGKLSPKKLDKFMTEFNNGLGLVLNQSMQQMLSASSTLGVCDVREQQAPRSYLNNTSVQGHLTQVRNLGLL